MIHSWRAGGCIPPQTPHCTYLTQLIGERFHGWRVCQTTTALPVYFILYSYFNSGKKKRTRVTSFLLPVTIILVICCLTKNKTPLLFRSGNICSDMHIHVKNNYNHSLGIWMKNLCCFVYSTLYTLHLRGSIDIAPTHTTRLLWIFVDWKYFSLALFLLRTDGRMLVFCAIWYIRMI